MITSTKSTLKRKKHNRQSEPQNKWQKQSYTDKNHTKKQAQTHSQKEKKEKIYTYIYK